LQSIWRMWSVCHGRCLSEFITLKVHFQGVTVISFTHKQEPNNFAVLRIFRKFSNSWFHRTRLITFHTNSTTWYFSAFRICCLRVSRDCSVGIATCYWLHGLNSGVAGIFHTRPDRSWGLPPAQGLKGLFPEVNRSGSNIEHSRRGLRKSRALPLCHPLCLLDRL
jgi:hypothetical protein